MRDNIDSAELDRLISLSTDQSLSHSDAQKLDSILENSAEAQQRYNELHKTHTALCEVFPSRMLRDFASPQAQDVFSPSRMVAHSSSRQPGRLVPRIQLAAALSICLLIGLTGYMIGKNGGEPYVATPDLTHTDTTPIPKNTPTKKKTWGGVESTLTGHAVLRKTIDVSWPNDEQKITDGSLLPPGGFAFSGGVAVIDFFCGATLVVEGPAQLDVISDWAVSVKNGRIEATVPPAAQGFIVKAAGTDIIDLGTRFALDMSEGRAQVAVIDGEVLLRGKQFDDDLLQAGEQTSLDREAVDSEFLSRIPQLDAIEQQSRDDLKKQHASYRHFMKELAADPRLIALFPAEKKFTGRRYPNIAKTDFASAGQLLGLVETVPGRFEKESVGVLMSRPGSRIRTKINGTFSAYTFSCWAKINSLKHKYNALFLSDGYENGEPHWQIRHDGQLMFSVMVDDSQELFYSTGPNSPPIQDKGLHHVYFSDAVWMPSMTGQWVHLAAVYDPAARLVTQYVNGTVTCQEKIENEFVIDTLQIGAAEIGNWGQPFRKTPDFAVRNLDGVIDEMIILNAALSSDEIHDIYVVGRVH
ncbi:MAG: hypothetical protein HN985_09680 [Planctomycetaceae bacterium]|nr:hypothetical protein [Planctomycetaceae bacterium]